MSEQARNDNYFRILRKILLFHRTLFSVTSVTILFSNGILLLQNFQYLTHQITVEEMSNTSEAYFLQLLCMTALYPILTNLSDINALIETTKLFLNVESIDPENESKAIDVFVNLQRTKRVLPFFTIVTATAFTLQGVYKREPIVYMHIPNMEYGFELLFVCQLFTLYLAVFAVLTANGFFIGVCATLASQFRLLRFLISNSVYEKQNEFGAEKMKRMIDYHNVLLKSAKMVRNIYSVSFVGLYLITIGIICTQVYVLTRSTLGLVPIIKRLGSALVMIIQMAYYCFIAQIVKDESEKLAFAVYNPKWVYSNNKKHTFFIRMVIMRSQKAATFTAGNMVDVDRKLIVSIFQMAISIFTLLISLN